MLDLASIIDRWAKATPGPWEWEGGAGDWQRYRLWRASGCAEVIIPAWDGEGEQSMQASDADARAIAAAPTDIAALLSELDRLTAALAAAQPVVEWQDHPQVGLLGEDRSWSVVERGHFRLWVDVDGWHLLCSLPGLPANRSIASGPETGPAGKAACEAAYRRAVGLPPK